MHRATQKAKREEANTTVTTSKNAVLKANGSKNATVGKHTASAARNKRPGPLSELPNKRLRTEASPINTAPTQKLDIYVFGDGDFGELGLGHKPIYGEAPTNVRVPRHNKLLNALGVTQVAVGGMHCVALTQQGKIVTWGVNDHGALGRDTVWEAPTRDIDDESGSDEEESDLNPKESTPTIIPEADLGKGRHTFVQVAATNSASFALSSKGLVFGWGTFSGNDGAVGFSPEGALQAAKTKKDEMKLQRTPAPIPHLTKIKSLAAGGNHVLALDQKGRAYAWGAGEQSQLGIQMHTTRNSRYSSLSPHPLILPGIKQIACGAYASFAITLDGLVYAWGLNNFGQTGIPDGAGEDNAFVSQPTVVGSLRPYRIRDIQGGEHHSIACTEDGLLLVWGRCDYGQAGINLDGVSKADLISDNVGRPRILLRPTLVAGVKNVVAVAAGIDTSFAITEEGSAWAWGYSEGFRTGLGTSKTVYEATLIEKGDVVGKRITFAGAGGQFGVLAGFAES